MQQIVTVQTSWPRLRPKSICDVLFFVFLCRWCWKKCNNCEVMQKSVYIKLFLWIEWTTEGELNQEMMYIQFNIIITSNLWIFCSLSCAELPNTAPRTSCKPWFHIYLLCFLSFFSHCLTNFLFVRGFAFLHNLTNVSVHWNFVFSFHHDN